MIFKCYVLALCILLVVTHCEETILQPTTGQYSEVGYYVSTDGEWMALGASENEYGSVYMYNLVDNDWVYHSRIKQPSLAYSFRYHFGSSVSISNDRIAIAARSMDYAGQSFAGAVFIYQFNVTSDAFEHQGSLYPPTPTAYEYFGTRLALHDGSIAIGSDLDAYYSVMDPDTGEWTPPAALDVWLVSFKKARVAVSYPYMAVTGPYDDYSFDDEVGVVCLFDLSRSDWYDRDPTIIHSPDRQEQALFGYGVSIDMESGEHGRMAVGEAYWDLDDDLTNVGRVHVFSFDGSSDWDVEATIEGAKKDSHLGIEVSLSDVYLGYTFDNYRQAELKMYDPNYGWIILAGTYQPSLSEPSYFGYSLTTSSPQYSGQFIIGSPEAYYTDSSGARWLKVGAAYCEDLPASVPIPCPLYPAVSMPDELGICQPLEVSVSLLDSEGSAFTDLDLSYLFSVVWDGADADPSVSLEEDGTYLITVLTPQSSGDYPVTVLFNDAAIASETVTLESDKVSPDLSPLRLPRFAMAGDEFPVKLQPRSYCGTVLTDVAVTVQMAGDSAVASAANDFTVGLWAPAGRDGVYEVTAAVGDQSWADAVTVTDDHALPPLLLPYDEEDTEAGFSLASDGPWLIVGGPYRNFDMGSAFIYQYVTPTGGDTGSWVKHTEIFTSDVMKDSYYGLMFGYSVAVSGDRAAVGASYYQDSQMFQGAVVTYSYDADTDTWSKDQILIDESPSANMDELGAYLAMQDDLIVTSGSHYVYYSLLDSDTGVWSSLQRFGSIDGIDLSFSSLSLSSQWLAAGAYRSDCHGRDSGAVVVYDITTPSFWESPPAQIVNSPSYNQVGFGCDVAVDASGVPRMVVGEYRWANAAGTKVGRAHVYGFNGTGWDLELTVTGDDSDIELGTHVTITGSLLAVTHENQSVVTVYSRDTGQWVEHASFFPELGETSYYFGNDLLLRHSQVLIGSPYASYINPDESHGNSEAGAVYVELL
eukprot:gnl/Dysnectes_brevis/3398_a4275_629.p1 GENE.gnl/Dysnectes_brevis/3398_a4275_629~~gnl/Dysnectes_brevis/3398_a4275_629.p1  ORF type:complete len:981 (-),score=381.32 gnl/Dysnectes_brevis/3398_a4275_629:85-3027(-)